VEVAAVDCVAHVGGAAADEELPALVLLLLRALRGDV
jgi:hypothetical protein